MTEPHVSCLHFRNQVTAVVVVEVVTRVEVGIAEEAATVGLYEDL